MSSKFLIIFPLVCFFNLIGFGFDSNKSNSLQNSEFSADDIKSSLNGGCKFLLEIQNPDGSWGSARQTKGLNIFAPVPGSHRAFRLAVTALSISALLEIKSSDINYSECLANHYSRI